MKHYQPNKWLLTTALLAVLGANYTMQTQSRANGSFEFASNKPAEAQSAAQVVEGAPSPLKVVVVSKDSQSKPTQKPAVAASPSMQASVVELAACTSGECKNVPAGASVLLKIEDYQKLTSRISELEKSQASASAAVTSASATTQIAEVKPASEYDECIQTEEGEKESRSERRARLACEKRAKEQEKREVLVDRFQEKMEDLKDRCGSDLECLAEGFNSALNRFSGRNSLPENYIRTEFKKVIGKPLESKLYSSDAESAMGILSTIIDGLPEEFKSLKQTTLDIVKNEASKRAALISRQYKEADLLAKANNPQAYLQAQQQAEVEHTELAQMTEAYSAVARTSDAFQNDSEFARYYQASYVPALQRMFSTIRFNTTAQEPAEATTTRSSTTRGASENREVIRDADSKVSVIAQPPTWEPTTTSNGVQFGSPYSQPRGGRTSRQMGN